MGCPALMNFRHDPAGQSSSCSILMPLLNSASNSTVRPFSAARFTTCVPGLNQKAVVRAFGQELAFGPLEPAAQFGVLRLQRIRLAPPPQPCQRHERSLVARSAPGREMGRVEALASQQCADLPRLGAGVGGLKDPQLVLGREAPARRSLDQFRIGAGTGGDSAPLTYCSTALARCMLPLQITRACTRTCVYEKLAALTLAGFRSVAGVMTIG